MEGNCRLFGTDGMRGRANVYPMTGETAFLLGRAVVSYFERTGKKNKKPLVIIGKDTRRSGYMIEHAFSAGICSQGGDVYLTGPLPTPGVAFVTMSMRADVGVMISASHNDFHDNGIKIFDAKGLKLPDSAEVELERLVFHPDLMDVKLDERLGRAKRLKEVFGRYIVHAKGALSSAFDLEGLRIVLDCANGAAYKVGPMIFSELGAEVIPLGVEPDGVNINLKTGALYPDRAREAVSKFRADVGICLDGDGDRFVVIDEKGRVVHGDKIVGLFAKFLLESGDIATGGTVVGTVMSNMGLETYVRSLGLDFVRTRVGDRYIVERMEETGSLLGGEPSGHIVLKNHTTTGDGALCALKFIECMRYYGRKASELTGQIEMYPQVLENVRVEKKTPFKDIPSVEDARRRAQGLLGDEGRILLRYSGTESLARVMVEGRGHEILIRKISRDIADLLSRELS